MFTISRNENPGGGGGVCVCGGGFEGKERTVSPETSKPQMSKLQNSESEVNTVLDCQNSSGVTDA